MNPLLQNRANGWRNLERKNMEIYSGKYMTLLANVISNKRDIQTISDKKSVIRYGKLNRIVRTDFRNNNLKALEDSIEFYLPKNVDNNYKQDKKDKGD